VCAAGSSLRSSPAAALSSRLSDNLFQALVGFLGEKLIETFGRIKGDRKSDQRIETDIACALEAFQAGRRDSRSLGELKSGEPKGETPPSTALCDRLRHFDRR
jgi:hypothetical protein